MRFLALVFALVLAPTLAHSDECERLLNRSFESRVKGVQKNSRALALSAAATERERAAFVFCLDNRTASYVSSLSNMCAGNPSPEMFKMITDSFVGACSSRLGDTGR